MNEAVKLARPRCLLRARPVPSISSTWVFDEDQVAFAVTSFVLPSAYLAIAWYWPCPPGAIASGPVMVTADTEPGVGLGNAPGTDDGDVGLLEHPAPTASKAINTAPAAGTVQGRSP